MRSKICGIKDSKTLKYLTNHNHSPSYIGFIINYPKSRRFIEFKNIENLIKIKRKKSKYVAVMVKPDIKFLNSIKSFNFDYYQLYGVGPKKTNFIKKKYNKKIISAITIEKFKDVRKYKHYMNISEIILFDSKGYEKSMGFDHSFLKNIPNNFTKMLAGNIRYNDKLDKFKKITDIIDLSGSLETSGVKDVKKIDIFLQNIKKLNDET